MVMKKNVKYMEEWKGEGGDTQGQNEERIRQSERERGGGGLPQLQLLQVGGRG